MLNLFTLKENNKTNTKHINNFYKTSKHFPSSLREWKNSIYVYNKNTLNLIPSTTITINNIIKSYFNLFNKKLETKIRTRRLLLRLRRLSSNKYYISNAGFKHTNNKVIINLYVFNRQKTNYLLALKKLYFKTFLKKITRKESSINIRLIKRIRLINTKGIQSVKLLNRNNHLFIKALNSVLENKHYNINNFKDLSFYTENFYKNLINKSLKKIKIYFYYKQLLYINRSKLNYTYLQYLKKHLERVYNKNVEFNIINIKRFYLNSDILSESITTKLSRNRRKLFKYLSVLTNKVVLKKKTFFNNIQKNKLLLQESVVNDLKYKYVTGFRLEAKGRLNRRFTASRSVFVLKYKGSLLNLDSSYKGLSSVLLKGNLKSNTQYTVLKSKSRIGSFGIKGWISGN